MHYLVAPRPTPNDLKNQGGSIHLCNARARSNVAVATSTALPERILDLRGINRLVLAQQGATARTVELLAGLSCLTVTAGLKAA